MVWLFWGPHRRRLLYKYKHLQSNSSMCQIIGHCLSVPNPPSVLSPVIPLPASPCQVLPRGELNGDCKVRGGRRDLLLPACFLCHPAFLLYTSRCSSVPEHQRNQCVFPVLVHLAPWYPIRDTSTSRPMSLPQKSRHLLSAQRNKYLQSNGSFSEFSLASP